MILAADNISAARPSLRRALEQRDQGFIADLCRRLASAGAHWLDLNPGYLPQGQQDEVWRFLVSSAEAACDLTLMLDAPDPAQLASALACCSRPPVLNMATARPERLGPVLDLAAAHDLRVVAAAMTDTVPVSAEGRLELAALIRAEADRRGIAGQRLILDPMVMPLALPGGEAHASAVLEVLRTLGQVFDPPPARLIALSNLTTTAAGPGAGFAAGPFLAAAFGAGLEVALLDVLDPRVMQVARLCRVFEGGRVFAPAEFSAAGA